MRHLLVPALVLLVISLMYTVPLIPETQGSSSGDKNKIQHVVIIIKENHSFDNYFGAFDRGADADPSLAFYQGKPVDEHVIPNLWHLAEQYVLCDHMYTSYPGYSFPNHLYLIAAWTPYGNPPSGIHNWSQAGYWPNRITLPDLLEAKGLSWRVYSWGKWGTYFPLMLTHARKIAKGHWYPAKQFIEDVRRGILANVTWVTDTDEITDHPPHNITEANQLTGEEVRAIMESPYWDNTVIFIIEDDHGGFPDHLHIETPEYHDGIVQKWYRVPCIIVSPLVKKGYISHEFYEFTSILKFIETVFGLPSINQRDFMPGYFQDCFDESLIRLPDPPKFFLQDFWTGKNTTELISEWLGKNLATTITKTITSTHTETLTKTSTSITTKTSTLTVTETQSATSTVTYTSTFTSTYTITYTTTQTIEKTSMDTIIYEAAVIALSVTSVALIVAILRKPKTS